MADSRFRVVLAHDDSLLRTELRRAFSSSGSFAVVDEVTTGLQAINAVARTKPDAIVLGLLVPVINALGALPLLRAASPDTKVMVLSVAPNAKLSRVAGERGASLCEREDLPTALLVERLQEILEHPSHTSPGLRPVPHTITLPGVMPREGGRDGVGPCEPSTRFSDTTHDGRPPSSCWRPAY